MRPSDLRFPRAAPRERPAGDGLALRLRSCRVSSPLVGPPLSGFSRSAAVAACCSAGAAPRACTAGAASSSRVQRSDDDDMLRR